MHSSKAIIIGSGVAGLATAIRLAVQGFQVSVYEKNTYPGGKLSAFEQEGFHFDAGPSLFTQPENIEELFNLTGEPMAPFFSWLAVDISCKYFYENGKQVDAYTHPGKLAAEIHTRLDELPQTVTRYLQQAEKLYDNVGTIFLNNALHKRKTWFNLRWKNTLAAVKLQHLFFSLNRYNSSRFKSPEAIQLFNRFATYNGSNPYQAPAMLSLIPHLELNKGTYYPAGGMISIANALFYLAKKKGVEFHFNSPVQRIMHHEGSVKGVVVNSVNIPSSLVVSNSDVYFTYKNLLADTRLAKKLLKQERSSSAVIFYWGIKKQFPKLHLHNIFFSADYKAEFNCLFKKGTLSSDPTIYVNITSKMEASQAPAGKENWFVMINAPANNGQDWSALKQQLRINVIKKLSRMLGEDVESLIESESVSDPVLIEAQTASYMGSLYGTSSNSKLAAFLRHSNDSATIKGLYFCGGSVHPGGGIPLCLKSAAIVSDLIKEAHK